MMLCISLYILPTHHATFHERLEDMDVEFGVIPHLSITLRMKQAAVKWTVPYALANTETRKHVSNTGFIWGCFIKTLIQTLRDVLTSWRRTSIFRKPFAAVGECPDPEEVVVGGGAASMTSLNIWHKECRLEQCTGWRALSKGWIAGWILIWDGGLYWYYRLILKSCHNHL
jgi:hypothetical protein